VLAELINGRRRARVRDWTQEIAKLRARVIGDFQVWKDHDAVQGWFKKPFGITAGARTQPFSKTVVDESRVD
jgi:hypothetical protein